MAEQYATLSGADETTSQGLLTPSYASFPLPATTTTTASHAGHGFSSMTMDHSTCEEHAMSPTPSDRSHPSPRLPQPATPLNVYPPPAYVSAFGASQSVSQRKRRMSDVDSDDDGGAARQDMDFSDAALALVNGFLDHLLYSILLHARSTTLPVLRLAVTDVLRSRLASEAIASAEEELSELLAGGEEEEDELNQKQSVSERLRKWDTELVWKRTRLRVMVYIRFGDVEDEDEERFVRDDEAFDTGDRRFSQSAGLVSWAAAIFLTSILEYIAELLLQVAAQVADTRARRLSRNSRVTMSASGRATPTESLVVHEHDMEKAAVLHKTAGRLWRQWRRSARNCAVAAPSLTTTDHSTSRANNPPSRQLSRDNIHATALRSDGAESASDMEESRPTSRTMLADQDLARDEADDELEYPEHILAANIPLPVGDTARDIEEINDPEHVIAASIPLPLADEARDVEDIERPEHVIAAGIALPMIDAKRDMDEIEVPGLAHDPDAIDTPVGAEQSAKRRNSWAGRSWLAVDASDRAVLVASHSVGGDAAEASVDEPSTERTSAPPVARVRSSSVPRMLRRRAQPAPPAAASDTTPLAGMTDHGQEQENGFGAVPGSAQVDVTESDHVSERRATNELGKNPPSVGDDNDTMAEAVAATSVAAAGTAIAVGAVMQSSNSARERERTGPYPSTQNEIESRSAEQEQIDKRETQKALPDMKRMSLPTGQNFVRKSSGQHGDEVPRMAKRMSLTQAVLVRPPPLGKMPTALPDATKDLGRSDGDEEEQKSDIGVAKTSDTVVSTLTGDYEEGVHQARDSFTNPTPRRPTRIVLGDSPGSSTSSYKSSPLPKDEESAAATLSPESFLKRRSLSSKGIPCVQQLNLADAQTSNEQERLPAPKTSVRTEASDDSGPAAGPVSPMSENASFSWRQSFPAAAQEGSQWPSSRKNSAIESVSSGAVQQHPSLQERAMKSQISLYDTDGSQPLTSASIRGPEDFEMFVHGGDTVKYTLTPESVRDESVSALHGSQATLLANGLQSPTETASHPKTSRSAERLAASPNKASSVSAPVDDPRVGRSQAARQATAANTDAGAADGRARSPTSSRDNRRSISRPPVRNTSVHKRSGLLAREPQVVTESTRDFADFIRSTGPDKEPELRPLLSNRSTTSLQALRDAHTIRSRSASPAPSRARSMSRSNIEAEDLPPVPAMPPPMPTSNRLRSHMQPRAPTQLAEDGTAELIDFIRNGPMSPESARPGESRQHRISRTVAPFRTTMDSDQMYEWGERYTPQPDLILNAATSGPSVDLANRGASSSTNSYRTSATSRSALLHNGARSPQDTTQPAYSDQPPRLTTVIPRTVQHDFPMSGDGPGKTRYRNKDPYAIDFDDLLDDEDDFITALPKGRKREQESLIDFLRNSEPPDTNNTTTSSNVNAATSAASARNGSTPQGLKTFGADAVSYGRKGSMQRADGPQPARSTPASRTMGSMAIAVGPASTTRANLQARNPDADYTGPGGTRDLADFFRTQAPPSAFSDPVPRMTQRSDSKASLSNSKASITSSQKKSRMSFLGGGVGNIFGRGSRKAYLDM